MMQLKNWVKCVLTRLDSWLVRWLNAAITIISPQSDSLNPGLQDWECKTHLSSARGCLCNADLSVLSVYVASACHSDDCKLSDLWITSKMEQENLITLQREREREREEKQERLKEKSKERKTWDNWTELPLKLLAAEFMSPACGAYL